MKSCNCNSYAYAVHEVIIERDSVPEWPACLRRADQRWMLQERHSGHFHSLDTKLRNDSVITHYTQFIHRSPRAQHSYNLQTSILKSRFHLQCASDIKRR